MQQIQTQIGYYGFAVVMVHPMEYGSIQNNANADILNGTQYQELLNLFTSVRGAGLNIVPIREINTAPIVATTGAPVTTGSTTAPATTGSTTAHATTGSTTAPATTTAKPTTGSTTAPATIAPATTGTPATVSTTGSGGNQQANVTTTAAASTTGDASTTGTPATCSTATTAQNIVEDNSAGLVIANLVLVAITALFAI
jgi:hypothetical protein